MKKILLQILLIICCLSVCEMAAGEVIYLRSGARLSGTIVFQNDEVVVFKDATGSRYQYLMTDVERIATDEVVEEVKEEVAPEKEKKVTASLQLSGGGSALPGIQAGGSLGADLVIGSANLFDRGIVLGGGVGYHADIIGRKACSFVPLQIRGEVPLMQTTHAPMLAAGVGYGIGLSKGVKGGIYGDFAFGWRYRTAHSRALFLGVFASAQSAKLTVTETLDGSQYSSETTRTFVRYGVRLSVYL